MSAAITFSWIAGHSSAAHPCSVMSGQTPVAMSWSTARIVSTETPFASMIAIDFSASAWVCETSGERFSVQLMYSARKSEKSIRNRRPGWTFRYSVCDLDQLDLGGLRGLVAGRVSGRRDQRELDDLGRLQGLPGLARELDHDLALAGLGDLDRGR